MEAARDAMAFATAPHVLGPVVGPVLSADGQAMQTIVPVDIGTGGWQDLRPRWTACARPPPTTAWA